MDINNLPLSAEVENNTFSFEINVSEDNAPRETDSNLLLQVPQDGSSVETENILKNGIFVQTNSGVICMSLKDVLNSNLNMSVEDFKKVAALLLSQSQEDAPTSSDETVETQGEIEFTTNFNSDPYTSEFSEFTPQSSDVEMKTEVNTAEPMNETDHFESNEIMLNNYSSLAKINSDAVETEKIPPKRRGGWPKGRKRKPELLNLPPKAPKTSYNIFLNERRKLYKDKLAFHEITRVVGNQWSNLTAEEKKPYIQRAEEDKKRYREELTVYRQSDAYKLYLARKRKKRALDNLMSESDMDGTDDIDDEDNDMLYCNTCDMWFYNLHNKKEHLQSRQHKMTVVGDMNKNLANSDSETKGHFSSLDESSMDAAPAETDSTVFLKKNLKNDTKNVYDNMVKLIDSVSKRENEIKVLESRRQESEGKQNSYLSELHLLKMKKNSLERGLVSLKEVGTSIEQQLIRLWNVPSLFVMNTVEFVNVV